DRGVEVVPLERIRVDADDQRQLLTVAHRVRAENDAVRERLEADVEADGGRRVDPLRLAVVLHRLDPLRGVGAGDDHRVALRRYVPAEIAHPGVRESNDELRGGGNVNCAHYIRS